MKFRVSTLTALFLIFTSFSTIANAQSHDRRTTHFHFNPVMEPDGLQDVVVECYRNHACWGPFRGAVASLTGVDVNIVGTIASLGYEKKGEETRQWLKPDQGWSFCRANLVMISAAPKTSGDKSSFSIGMHSSGMGLYAHTPRQNAGRGRSWIDLVIVVEQVKSAQLSHFLNSGDCTIAPGRAENWEKRYSCNSRPGTKSCRSRHF